MWESGHDNHPKSPGINPVTAEFNTLSGHFIRIFKSDQVADSICGNFFYLGGNKMHIEVSYPLNQMMIIESNITTIYYPDSKQGVRLESTNPVILPLVPGLMMAIRSDYGLSNVGYRLNRQEVKDDTLFAYWSHPKQPDKLGLFKIAEFNNRLIYSKFTAPNAKITSNTIFSNHVMMKGLSFPAEIVSVVISPQGNSFEKIMLKDLKVDEPIAAAIKNFQIPSDVVIEKKQW